MTKELAYLIVYHDSINSDKWTKFKSLIRYQLIRAFRPSVHNLLILLLLLAIYVITQTKMFNSITHRIEYKVIYLPSQPIPLETKKFMSAISKFESTDDYTARRPNSQYLGRYQIGNSARESIGLGGLNTPDGYTEFLRNSELQDIAMYLLIKRNYKSLERYINKYSNTRVGSYYVTTSGIIAMAHSAGVTSVIKFLESNGKIIAVDGNNKKMTDYLQFNGFTIAYEN